VSDLELVLYPDPILKKRAAEITEVDESVRVRAVRMIEIMYEKQGVGLAAPQVGWSVRLFVMNPEPEQPPEGERIYINPRIVAKDDEEVSDEEGCLSIPDLKGKVKRPFGIEIETELLDGDEVRTVREELTDLPARVFQHELDHLDGILFIRYLSATEKLFAKKVLRHLEKKYKEKHKDDGDGMGRGAGPRRRGR